MARGFYWSILFMLTVPALILTGFAGTLYLSYRKWLTRRASAQERV